MGHFLVRSSNKCTESALARQPSKAVGPVPPGAMHRPTSESQLPSLGSFGHPMSCAAPCKYNSKSRGCKDGYFCDHCYLPETI